MSDNPQPEPLSGNEFTRLRPDVHAVTPGYVTAYPHLRTLAQRSLAGDDIAIRDFARAACRLSVPPGVSLQQVWTLAQVAQGWK